MRPWFTRTYPIPRWAILAILVLSLGLCIASFYFTTATVYDLAYTGYGYQHSSQYYECVLNQMGLQADEDTLDFRYPACAHSHGMDRPVVPYAVSSFPELYVGVIGSFLLALAALGVLLVKRRNRRNDQEQRL